MPFGHNRSMSLSSRLRSARKARGLTQRELADRTGLDQGHISHVERGIHGMSQAALRRLAAELEVSLAFLIDEERRMTAQQRAIIDDQDAPAGLRDLAASGDLVEWLQITNDEWTALRSTVLPAPATRDGYVQLLFTIRAITGA